MAYFVLLLGIAVIGLSYLIRGEFKLTKNRIVKAPLGRNLGILLLLGVGIDFLGMNAMGGFLFTGAIAMIIVIAIGLTKAEKVVG